MKEVFRQYGGVLIAAAATSAFLVLMGNIVLAQGGMLAQLINIWGEQCNLNNRETIDEGDNADIWSHDSGGGCRNCAAVGIWGSEEQNECGICATGYIEQR